jgi:hypothetical protein
MNPSIIFFYIVLIIVCFSFLFVPIVTNPHPIDCTNYPDGTGGYYLKCNDEHISLYKKWHIPKDQPETRQRTF